MQPSRDGWTAKWFPTISDAKIDTESFLDAARGVVLMVEKFGKLFAPVKTDMNGNIEKINKQYLIDKSKHSTLHDMIILELSSGTNLVIISLLWLTRALHFMEVFLEKLFESPVNEANAQESIKNELNHAYMVSLKRYHGWLNQNVFSLICRMSPSRSEFLRSLGYTEDAENFYKEAKLFLHSLRQNRIEINRFYAEHNLENNDIV